MGNTWDASPFDVIEDATVSEVSRRPEISGAVNTTFVRNAVREAGRALPCPTAPGSGYGESPRSLHETVQTWGGLGKLRSDSASHRSYHLPDRYVKRHLLFFSCLAQDEISGFESRYLERQLKES